MSFSTLSPFRPSSLLDVQYIKLPDSDLLVRRMNMHTRHQICALGIEGTDEPKSALLPYNVVSIATEDGLVTLIHSSVIEGTLSIVLNMGWCLTHHIYILDVMHSGYCVPRCFHCFYIIQYHEDGCIHWSYV